jgi:hypothetical protein
MKRMVYQYAILRFMPRIETSEFANVGVVMSAPHSGFFAYRLQEKIHTRLTNFFKNLDGHTYTVAMRAMKEELNRIQQLIHTHQNESYRLFEELIRPRETLFRFSEPGVVLTDKPETQLVELYRHYVDKLKYRETILETSVRDLLIQACLADRYKPTKLGDDEYRVILPFVVKKGDKLLKAIQPLYLGQKETHKILEKAGQWQFRIEELKRRKQLPKEILFVVEGPEHKDLPQGNAYQYALDLLMNTGARVVPVSEKEAVLDFARA